MEQDPIPPYEPVQREGEAAFATSALQMSLVEPANAGPAQLSTPNSVAMSMPSSKAVSATSSNPDAAVPRTRRSTITARCSRNYRGPYTQPASSSSRSHLPPPQRSPSPLRHYSPLPSRRHSPVRNVSPRCYSPPTRHYSQRSPSPVCRSICHQSPSPPNATLGTIRGRNMPNVPSVRIIQMQELHRIVQDTDTGISAIVPVMQVSSSQMGLDLLALMRPVIPEGRSQNSCLIEGAHNSGSAHYRSRPRSHSLPRKHRSRQRSPSPIPLRHPSLARRCSLSPPRHRPFVPRRPSPPARRSNYGLS